MRGAWALAALAAALAVATAKNVCPSSPEVLSEPFGEVTMELEMGELMDVGLQCQWRIQGAPGSEVHVSFNWVVLDSRCEVTHLVVLDGEGAAGPMLTERICGTKGKDQVVAVSTGSSATVVLEVDEKSVSNEGFEFRYEIQAPTNNTVVDCEVGSCPSPGGGGGSPGAFWSLCSRECGGGVQQCTRPIIVEPENGGMDCPDAQDRTEERVCNDFACPSPTPGPSGDADCQVGPWSEWGRCEPLFAACGAGSRSRSRNVTQEARGAGADCPSLLEEEDCTVPCPSDDDDNDDAAPAEEFNIPDGACEPQAVEMLARSGVIRVGDLAGPGAPPGLRCAWVVGAPAGATVELRWLWASAETPAHECDDGAAAIFKGFEGAVLVPPAYCSLSESDARTLPAVRITNSTDFDVTVAFMSGSAGGGKGLAINYTVVTPQPSPGPAVDCVVSAWSNWSVCNSTCGASFRERHRAVITPSGPGGAPCPDLVETMPCDKPPCAASATPKPQPSFSPDPAASASASPDAMPSVSASPDAMPSVSASPDAMPSADPSPSGSTDCVVSEWGNWSACTVECGGGVRERSRSIIVPKSGNGAPCGELTQEEPCNQESCLPEQCTAAGRAAPATRVGLASPSSASIGPAFAGVANGFYPGGLDCAWHFEAPEGSLLRVVVDRLSVEADQGCTDAVSIGDDSGGTGHEEVLCGYDPPAQDWTSTTNSVTVRFRSAASQRDHTGSGFGLKVFAVAAKPPSEADAAVVAWTIGSGYCTTSKCSGLEAVAGLLRTDVANALGCEEWRVHVMGVDCGSGAAGQECDVSLQLLPPRTARRRLFACAEGGLSFVAGPRRLAGAAPAAARPAAAASGTVYQDVVELQRQLAVAEPDRAGVPLWSGVVTQFSVPETLTLSYASQAQLGFDPPAVTFTVPRASILGPTCTGNPPTAPVPPQTLLVLNTGASSSALTVDHVSIRFPFPPAVALSAAGVNPGGSVVAGGGSLPLTLTVLPCVPVTHVAPIFAEIVVATSDVDSVNVVPVLVKFEPLPMPTPSAAPAQPSPTPAAPAPSKGLIDSIDWVSIGIGAGAVAVLGVLAAGVCLCRACGCCGCCGGKPKKPRAGAGVGSGPASRARPGAPKRSASGVLSTGSVSESEDDSAGRGGGSSRHAKGSPRKPRREPAGGDGVELTSVKVGAGAGRRRGSEDLGDGDGPDGAFKTLTPATAAWEPPAVSARNASAHAHAGRAPAPAAPATSTVASWGARASPAAPAAPPAPPLALDPMAQLAADAFEGRWGAAPAGDFFGGTLRPHFASNPERIETALKAASIICIASGDVGGVHKSYFFGKDKGSGRLFMAELSVTLATRHMTGMVRAEQPSDGSDGQAHASAFAATLRRALQPALES
ncbi:hypothetical protein FNF28_02594 [Cafeteria roenbergensis]|uniref:CUB domain-containing protein n=1 Tax=Cafeteria roenbergensis TaxID=33653 RepID=A0A5A8DRQ0_CAFRO|nr:hypothetical protein FNF28_02594 [Cafeteria roenbergensis]